MIFRLADNIISPLGETTAENYQAVKAGRSALCRYTQKWGVPEPFTASLFTDEQISSLAVEGFSRFESLALRSASKAVQAAHIDVSAPGVVFILSSAKANIECLSATSDEDTLLYPGAAAKRIAGRLGFTTEPVVVCNACISGVSAILLALRLLEARIYDYAVICGADVQSKFTISGFQSLKAVSVDDCRPFDIERIGLNLGEAAATLVVGREPQTLVSSAPWGLKATGKATGRRAKLGNGQRTEQREQSSLLELPSRDGRRQSQWTEQREQSSLLELPIRDGRRRSQWSIRQGAVRNDAFHISSPSKDGEGARLALEAAKAGIGPADLAVVNAHGTATMFNDQMESVAIERSGLSDVPVNALKGYFGHTLGAAGILETLITMASLDDHTVIATRGFAEYGVSGNIHLSSHNEPATKTSFIKMISGFGGGNGAILVEKEGLRPLDPQGRLPKQDVSPPCSSYPLARQELSKVHAVHLTPTSLTIDFQTVPVNETGAHLLTSLYKQYVGDYPKFYKMDGMSRLGFVASELLLRQELERVRFQSCDNRAVILFNHSTSIVSDRKYLRSIACHDDYYPSPSVFVYTLPSIVTGEIAMRNNYHGETSFYILEKRDDALAWQILSASFGDQTTKSIVGGWIDYQDDSHFEADFYIAEQKFND